MALFEQYIEKENTKLRLGYTTGSCAAGASKAAVLMLNGSEKLSLVTIDTPAGIRLTLELEEVEVSEKRIRCAVRKFSGDDPDITNGALIFSTVTPTEDPGIHLVGGEGVGTITREGLLIPPGEAAINPVPRQMIKRELEPLLKENQGVCVEISCPEGVRLAKKTLNPRLGIKDGISILGTSGIVYPMSNESLKSSIVIEMDMLRREGHTSIILVPGKYGERFVREHLIHGGTPVVLTSNFIGFVVRKAVELGFRSILLAGHLGKLIKISGRIFNTHSSVADCRMELLAAHLVRLGGTAEQAAAVLEAVTVEKAVEFIDDPGFYRSLAEQISREITAYSGGEEKIEVCIYTMKAGLLGFSGDEKRWSIHE